MQFILAFALTGYLLPAIFLPGDLVQDEIGIGNAGKLHLDGAAPNWLNNNGIASPDACQEFQSAPAAGAQKWIWTCIDKHYTSEYAHLFGQVKSPEALVNVKPGLLLIFGLLLLAGCQSDLETGYKPKKLGVTDEERRAYYAAPFSPESAAAGEGKANITKARTPTP